MNNSQKTVFRANAFEWLRNLTQSTKNLPDGYRVEYKPGDYCFYGLTAFSVESRALSGRICGLYKSPQAGCQQEPVAYRGKFWHEAKHFYDSGQLDPDAVALYVGPVLYEPEQYRGEADRNREKGRGA